MKSAFYISLVFILLASCKSNTKQDAKDTTAGKSGNNQTEELIQKFKPIIQGVWVKKGYIDKVIKTKSPLAAVDEVNDITTMFINTDSKIGRAHV